MNKETSWRIIGMVQKLFSSIPYPISVKFGGFLGVLLWAGSKRKVDEAERRCVKALQVGVTGARKIVRRSYMNLGRSAAEFLAMGRVRDRLHELVEFHGEEHLKKALERGKGVILLSAHLGNWEIGAAAVAAKGYPMNAIGTGQRDERITNLIIEKRAAERVTTVSKGFDLKAAIRCLQRGEALAILVDQDVRDKGVVVPFLGLPASTPYGPAKIAQKLHCSLLPAFMIRRGTSYFHDFYVLPSPWEKGYPDENEDMEVSMTLCNNAISDFIKQYPDQWMWLYPRWASTEVPEE